MPALASVALLASFVLHEDPAPSSDQREGEIVVTGERVTRSLRDTSSSVAVIDQSEIEANGANRVDQILALIPNVQLGNGSQGPAIRGLDFDRAAVGLARVPGRQPAANHDHRGRTAGDLQ